MKKIIEYSLIDGGDVHNVTLLINEAIKKGYQPFGPISTIWVPDRIDSGKVTGGGFTRYTQTLVRYE